MHFTNQVSNLVTMGMSDGELLLDYCNAIKNESTKF